MILRESTLAAVKGQQTKIRVGIVFICVVIDRDLCFGLHFGGRLYQIQCKDKNSMAIWVESISSAIDAAKAKK